MLRFIILIAIIISLSPAAQAASFTAIVTSVSNGDTIAVVASRHDKCPIEIHLRGIDTPEKEQPFGGQAKQFISNLALDKEVRVKFATRDHNGRTVAEVYVDDKSLNKELLKAGLAWWSQKEAPTDIPLAKLELEAQRRKLGLWAAKNPAPPWGWGRAKGKTAKPADDVPVSRPALYSTTKEDRACLRDADCVFPPHDGACAPCPPCGINWRTAINRTALAQLKESWGPACVRLCHVPSFLFVGERAICKNGECTVVE